MTESRILLIRKSIAEAQRIESEQHGLDAYLQARLPGLHHSIALPRDNAVPALRLFVTRYIEQVPDFIEALTDLTESAGVYNYAKRFLTIAEDYFFQPPELVEANEGLRALIDEAYLAHRLIEELNDRVIMTCGVPLSPMDMTLANIIVHDIIGEEFANQLDLAVHYSIEALFETENFCKAADFERYLKQHHKNGWKFAIDKWPCLARDLKITLDLDDNAPPPNVH